MAKTWKPITVKIKSDILSDQVIKAGLKNALKPAQKDFQSFVGTFSPENKPTILLQVKKTRKGYEGFTGVVSNWSKGKTANKSDKFMFLARGTKKRYATMAPNFKAKSKRGVISSGAGGGTRTPLYVNTAKPQKGIESRNIEKTVRKKREPGIRRSVRAMVIKGIIRNKLGF